MVSALTTPTYQRPATAPRAATAGESATIRRPGEFPTAEFVTIPNVPVFAEHQTTARDGRPLRFGRKELEAVAARCNRRISDGGDYAAISLGHTPSPDAKAMGARDPEVVGFAGPFRVGLIGDGNQPKRYAILADFHVFRDDAAKLKKYPRRSPELWLEDSYSEMFLDPIALLGAEAPRLDMGLLYSVSRHLGGGKQKIVERYAAVAPAAGNVFVPGEKYAIPATAAAPPASQPPQPNPTPRSTSAMALAPEDIQAIVEAIDSLPHMQFLKQLMASQQSPAADMPPDGDMPAPGPDPNAAPAPDAAPAPGAPAGPPTTPPAPAPGGDDMPPAAGGGPGDEEDVQEKYGVMDTLTDDQLESYMRHRYGAGQDEQPPAPAPVVPTAAGAPLPAANGSGAEMVRYNRLSQELASLRANFNATRTQLQEERGKRIDAERLQELQSMRFDGGYPIDPAREIGRMCYSKMSDEQFRLSVEMLRDNLQPVPIGTTLPMATEEGVERYERSRPGAAAARNGHDAVTSQRAFEICQAAATAGREVCYEHVLAAVRSGDQTGGIKL